MRSRVLLSGIICLLAFGVDVTHGQEEAIPFDLDMVTSADAIRPLQVAISSNILAVIENGNTDSSGNLTTYFRASTGNSWQELGILPAPGIATSVDVEDCFMVVGKSGQVDVWVLDGCDTSKPTWMPFESIIFTNSTYSARKVDLYFNVASNVPRFAVLVDRPATDPFNPPGPAVYVYVQASSTNFRNEAELTISDTNEFSALTSIVGNMAIHEDRVVMAAPSQNLIAIHGRHDGGAYGWGRITMFSGSDDANQAGYDLAMDDTRIAFTERLLDGRSRVVVYTNTVGEFGDEWSLAGTLLESASVDETLSLSLDSGRLAVLGLSSEAPESGSLFARWWIYDAGPGPGSWSIQRQGETGTYRPYLSSFLPKPSLAGDRLALGFGDTNRVGRLTGGAITVLRADAGGSNQWGTEQIIQDQGTPVGFGDALAMSRLMMVSGMPRDNARGTNTGSAYVWTLADNESYRGWIPVAKLNHPTANTGDRFGESVAIFNASSLGSSVVVGAPGVFSDKGHVVCFGVDTFNGQSVPAQILQPSSHTNASRFGAAVATYLAWIAVGAPDHPGGGAVYLATVNASNASWEIVRTNFPPSSGIGYGSRVAMHANNLAVSRPYTNGVGRRVFMHRKDAGGTNAWGLSQTLLSPTNSPAGFGESVAFFPTFGESSILAVGATGSVGQAGAVFVYLSTPTTTNQWMLYATINGPAEDGPTFGSSLAFSDGLLSVGAPGAGTGGRVRLYSLFNWPDYAATNVTIIATRNGAAGEQLGKSVAAGSFYTVAGAPMNGTNGPNAGALDSFRVGSYEYWAGQQDPDFASAWLPDQDYDGDGHYNLAEFAANSSPTVSNNAPLFTMSFAKQGGADYFAWTVPETPYPTDGLEQVITVSTNLQNWSTTVFFFGSGGGVIGGEPDSSTWLFPVRSFQHHRLELSYPDYSGMAD